MKDKDGIIVNGFFPCLSVYADLEEIREAIGGSVEIVPYPKQFGRSRIFVCMNERGMYQPLPYGGWGIVGAFAVVKIAKDGRFLSLTEKEADGIGKELMNRSGMTGYLHPDSGLVTAFHEPFQKYGVPPLGHVPSAGCWFDNSLTA
jgi:hypothetical protein